MFNDAIILGFIQGITEPLPISSSGHVVFTMELLGINFPGMAFEALVNFGSLIAIIIFFFKTLYEIFIGFFKEFFAFKYNYYFKYVVKIILSTIPIGLVGLMFIFAQVSFSDKLALISISLLITGALLLLIKDKNGEKTIEDLSYFDAFIIGVGQCFALIPGISRSGITMITAISLGYDQEESFKYSFIMYVPVSLLAGLFGIYFLKSATTEEVLFFSVAAIIATIATLLSLYILAKVIKNKKLVYFAYYCFDVGIVTLLAF